MDAINGSPEDQVCSFFFQWKLVLIKSSAVQEIYILTSIQQKSKTEGSSTKEKTAAENN